MKPTVAVIGANGRRERFSNKSIRAHLAAGYEVFAINPKEAGNVVEGVAVYGSIRDIPVRNVDRVTMYVRPETGITLLEDIAEVGCNELYLNPGADSPELIHRAEELGLNPVIGCSIVDLGMSPAEFPG